VSYTDQVASSSAPDDPRASLRTEQVAQTRAALVAAGRLLFGRSGFAATPVEDLVRDKAALFEAVFEQVHVELLIASAQATADLAEGAVEWFTAGFDAFLDKVLEPDVQQIMITDAPAVLGLARFTEMDERYAYAAIVAGLQAATAAGVLRVEDPQTLARLLLGALTRAGMLIANSAEPRATRDAVAATLRALINGFAATPE
jgi:AcrR family transcriptional regulator